MSPDDPPGTSMIPQKLPYYHTGDIDLISTGITVIYSNTNGMT